jgi:hypothetical protein
MECPICYEFLEKCEILNCDICKNKFHKKCLDEWLCRKNDCPMCKYVFPINIPSGITAEYLIDRLMINIFNLSLDLQKMTLTNNSLTYINNIIKIIPKICLLFNEEIYERDIYNFKHLLILIKIFYICNSQINLFIQIIFISIIFFSLTLKLQKISDFFLDLILIFFSNSINSSVLLINLYELNRIDILFYYLELFLFNANLFKFILEVYNNEIINKIKISAKNKIEELLN